MNELDLLLVGTHPFMSSVGSIVCRLWIVCGSNPIAIRMLARVQNTSDALNLGCKPNKLVPKIHERTKSTREREMIQKRKPQPQKIGLVSRFVWVDEQ